MLRDAERAIEALHNQYTLPGASIRHMLCSTASTNCLIKQVICFIFFQGSGPIQVRYADGERERLGISRPKVFSCTFITLLTYFIHFK